MTQDKAQETRNHSDESPKAAQTEGLSPQTAQPLAGDEPSPAVRQDAPVPPELPEADLSPDPKEAAPPQSDADQPQSARDLPASDLDADLAQTLLPPASQPPAKRGTVLPLVLGGAVAAALGFGAAQYLNTGSLWPLAATENGLADRVAAQELALAAMAERLDAAPRGPDIAPLSREIADLRADLVAATDALRPELAALTTRVEALESGAPASGTGELPAAWQDSLQAAWAEEIDALKSALGAQDLRMQAIASEANARLEAAQAEIRGIEEAATNAAAAIARRGALSRVLAALDVGGNYQDALAEVVGDGVMPQMLASLAESGAPTLPQLQDHFSAAARAALAAARAENLAGEAGGFMGFLRNQFDVRSTAEREGDDPDAILSRAEARLSEYDLDAALAEIATLPEVVRAAMGDWLAMADTRKAALAEADALAAALNDN